MSISGLCGVILTMWMKIVYGDTLSIYTCLVFLAIGILIFFKEALSDQATMWLCHFLFASIIGLITLFFTIQPGFWSMSNDVLLLSIAFSGTVILGLVTIVGFLKELFDRSKEFYPRRQFA